MRKTTTIDTIVRFGILAFVLFAPLAARAISSTLPRMWSPASFRPTAMALTTAFISS
ncbi:MAG: hypothetical protein IPN19_13965 [Elusimicrobia bacterium]|nr:hypothetical protein [Elusimicrobiota bacterium]